MSFSMFSFSKSLLPMNQISSCDNNCQIQRHKFVLIHWQVTLLRVFLLTRENVHGDFPHWLFLNQTRIKFYFGTKILLKRFLKNFPTFLIYFILFFHKFLLCFIQFVISTQDIMQLYSFVAAVLLFPVVCKFNIILKLGFKPRKDE